LPVTRFAHSVFGFAGAAEPMPDPEVAPAQDRLPATRPPAPGPVMPGDWRHSIRSAGISARNRLGAETLVSP
jgi:hypothetical protein